MGGDEMTIQQATCKSVEVAYVDQGYAGDAPAVFKPVKE